MSGYPPRFLDDQEFDPLSSAGLSPEWWDAIEPSSEPKWLVQDLIPNGGLALLVGRENSGKSYLALDLCAHVAAGLPWFGCPTVTGLVVYLAAEDAPGLRCRIAALRNDREWPADLPLTMLPIDLDLTKESDLRKLMMVLRNVADARGQPIALIVIDTLSRTFGDRDENSSDMAVFVRSIGKLQAAFGATVIVVHHPAKRGGRASRGHSALPAACDTIGFVDAPPRGRLEITKQRNGRVGRTLCFSLRHDPVRDACLVEERGDSALPARGGLKGDLGVLLEQLRSLTSAEGIDPPDHFPREVRARIGNSQLVDAESWEQASKEKLEPRDRKPDSLRRAVSRAKEELVGKRIVDVREGWVWLAP